MQLEKVFELEDISRNSGSSDRYAYSAFVIFKIIICAGNYDTILQRLCDSKHWSKNYKQMSVRLEKVQVKNEGTLNINIVLSVCGFSPGLPLIQNGGGLAIW